MEKKFRRSSDHMIHSKSRRYCFQINQGLHTLERKEHRKRHHGQPNRSAQSGVGRPAWPRFPCYVKASYADRNDPSHERTVLRTIHVISKTENGNLLLTNELYCAS
jgi:hypothetical protein